jgi:addiction module RelE/StbE family toxin
LKVTWTPEAEAERLEIGEYIALDNPRAAVRMDSMFEAAVLKLADFPRIGRSGVIAGTRELIPHESYRIVYEIRDDGIWITSVVHTARRWPPDDSDT